MDHVGIAKVWRQRNQEHADSGVVLIWDGEAYGWKNVLRDPQHERPEQLPSMPKVICLLPRAGMTMTALNAG